MNIQVSRVRDFSGQPSRKRGHVSFLPPGIFLLLVLVLSSWGSPAMAEIDKADFLGTWCVVSQTMNGHEVEKVFKSLMKNFKARVGQSYQFNEDQTVKVTLRDKTELHLSYKVTGTKKNSIRLSQEVPGRRKNMVRMKGWESFAVKSLTAEEMKAKVLGTIQHRFTRGACK